MVLAVCVLVAGILERRELVLGLATALFASDPVLEAAFTAFFGFAFEWIPPGVGGGRRLRAPRLGVRGDGARALRLARGSRACGQRAPPACSPRCSRGSSCSCLAPICGWAPTRRPQAPRKRSPRSPTSARFTASSGCSTRRSGGSRPSGPASRTCTSSGSRRTRRRTCSPGSWRRCADVRRAVRDRRALDRAREQPGNSRRNADRDRDQSPHRARARRPDL